MQKETKKKDSIQLSEEAHAPGFNFYVLVLMTSIMEYKATKLFTKTKQTIYTSIATKVTRCRKTMRGYIN